MMEHQANSQHRSYLCDGTPQSGSGGSWIGHLLPAVILSLWGLHWFLAVCLQHLKQLRTVQCIPIKSCNDVGTAKKPSAAAVHQQARSAAAPATHRVLLLEPRGLQLEAWLKVILPCIAVYLEFKLSGTRYVYALGLCI
jgi:hypothetical protein